MDKASEAILALQPVTFRYKKEFDPGRIPQFGLMAEEVEKVNPDIIVRDADGKINTVRFEAVNAMLLNEFLKEHRKVEEQERKLSEQDGKVEKQDRKVQEQEKEIEALKAQLEEQRAFIQRVSDKVEMNRPAPQMALNDQIEN
jgi:predicted RNase H-like nuclease (RuvC/YqgF family)